MEVCCAELALLRWRPLYSTALWYIDCSFKKHQIKWGLAWALCPLSAFYRSQFMRSHRQICWICSYVYIILHCGILFISKSLWPLLRFLMHLQWDFLSKSRGSIGLPLFPTPPFHPQILCLSDIFGLYWKYVLTYTIRMLFCVLTNKWDAFCLTHEVWYQYSNTAVCFIKEILKSASLYRSVVEKCQGTCLSLNRSKWQKFVYSHINIAAHAFFYFDILLLFSICFN